MQTKYDLNSKFTYQNNLFTLFHFISFKKRVSCTYSSVNNVICIFIHLSPTIQSSLYSGVSSINGNELVSNEAKINLIGKDFNAFVRLVFCYAVFHPFSKGKPLKF